MKQYFIIVVMTLITNTVIAQKNMGQPLRYDVALHFNSICCGTPDYTFLKKCLRDFNKSNKVTVKAFMVGGCGREGEFKILLTYAGLSKKACGKLKAQLDALIPKQNASNKAANGNSGSIELQHNPVADDWQGCRVAMAPWKY